MSRVDDYKTSTCVDWDTVRLKHIVIRQVFPNVSKNVHQPVNPLFFFFIRNISQKENEKKIDTWNQETKEIDSREQDDRNCSVKEKDQRDYFLSFQPCSA